MPFSQRRRRRRGLRLRRRRNEGGKALVRWHEEEEGKREKIKLREKGERPEKANIACKQNFQPCGEQLRKRFP